MDLAAIDVLLSDRALLAPVISAWDERAREFGRPSIPIERWVRLMVIKTRTGWGYETLVKEVGDSLHLRRFCRIALTERVPDESTVRKLTRRLGSEVVDDITRLVIGREVRERRFTARAIRADSTVVEADVRFHRIASMAAGGMSNREIAQALFITVKTVEMHLGHVYQKLNVTGRAQLAAPLGSRASFADHSPCALAEQTRGRV